MPLRIEPTGAKDFGPCECCHRDTRRVWGYVHGVGRIEAAYFVEWTLGGVREHGAHFDLIVGRWGEGAERAERVAVALELRVLDSGPAFMVIDAARRAFSRSDLVGRALSREEVVGTPLARHVFDIVDAVWLQDRRVVELRGGVP
jgi:hypothetical protein